MYPCVIVANYAGAVKERKRKITEGQGYFPGTLKQTDPKGQGAKMGVCHDKGSACYAMRESFIIVS